MKQSFSLFSKKIFESYIIVLFFFLSIFLFTFNNHHEQLWYGEIVTIYLTDLSLDKMLYTLTHSFIEINPPLYFLIIKLIKVLFGGSIGFLRFFSAFCGAIFVILFYLFIEKIYSKFVAILSTLLVLFNPIIIHFSQEIRMYILATLICCIIQFSFFIALIQRKAKYWVIHTISLILGIYTHYYLIFLIPANFVFFIIIMKKDLKKIHEWLSPPIIFYSISQLIVILGFLPWLPTFLKHFRYIWKGEPQWIETFSWDIPLKIVAFFFTTKFTMDINPLVPYNTLTLIAIYFFAFPLYMMIKTKKFYNTLIFAFLTISIPYLLSILITIHSSIINFRYFLPYYPFFVFLEVVGIVEAMKRKKIFASVLVAFLILANLPTILGIYTKKFNGSAEDTALYIKEKNLTHEPIITFDMGTFLPIYYYLGKSTNIYCLNGEKIQAFNNLLISYNPIINKKQLLQLIEGKRAFWVVITPKTKNYPSQYLREIIDNYVEDSYSEKKFVYEYSWFRTKVIRYTHKEKLLVSKKY